MQQQHNTLREQKTELIEQLDQVRQKLAGLERKLQAKAQEYNAIETQLNQAKCV
jgi:uncharacterized coiled-coil DUF342 family protein